MPNEVNIYTPRYLAEVVRQAPPIHTYFRDTFFTNIKTFSTERVDIDLVKGDRRMAAFVHPRVGGQVLKANGFSTESYKPPLINPYDVTTADQHMTRLPGEDLYSGMTPAQRAARKLMDEYNRLNDATTRREEWMCVQAIVTGQIPIVGPGVNEVIDFGFTNKIKLDGTKQWGKTAAKPIEDLEDWTEKVLTGGFTNVDRVIMGKAALRAFINDEKVQKLLDNRRIEIGNVEPELLPDGAAIVARLNVLGRIISVISYDLTYTDDEGNDKLYIPSGKCVLTAPGAGRTAYGAVSQVEQSDGEFHTYAGRRVPKYVSSAEGNSRTLTISSRPLMIPNNKNPFIVADVLTD